MPSPIVVTHAIAFAIIRFSFNAGLTVIVLSVKEIIAATANRLQIQNLASLGFDKLII